MVDQEKETIVINEEDLPAEPSPQIGKLTQLFKKLPAIVEKLSENSSVKDQIRVIENIGGALSVDDIDWVEEPLSVDDIDWEKPLSVDDIDWLDKPLPKEDEDLTLRIAVSAQNNRETALWFFKRLRQIAQTLPNVVIQNNVKNEREKFGSTDLIDLANRWQIPIVVKEQGGHWFLLLSGPQKNGNKWQSLAYNPYLNQETWIDMPGYNPSESLNSTLHKQTMYANGLGLYLLQQEKYNLSLPMDFEAANDQDLIEAKRTNLQPRIDIANCGPACLLMAAIRTGIQSGDNLFKFEGRKIMEGDLSTEDESFKIFTREDILNK